jgi:hypothetical protein
MRHLLPAIALAAAVTLFAAVPTAGAQNGDMGMGGYGSGMSYDGGMGMGLGGMGMGMMPGMGMGMGMSSSNGDSTSQSYTCAYGQVLPFVVPQQGIDQLGRPFFYQAQGTYGPYDGFGYPVVIQTIGSQPGGQPFARLSRGYIPSPCPVGMGGMSGLSSLGSMGMPGMGMMPGMTPSWGSPWSTVPITR